MTDQSQEKTAKLLEYSRLEGTEFGEYCECLCLLTKYYFCMPSELIVMIEREKSFKLDWFETHTRIIKKTETREHIFTTLEIIDD